VREELVPEPDPLARPLNQARDVGNHELPPVGGFDDAQHRLERREWIFGDLRARVREASQQ